MGRPVSTALAALSAASGLDDDRAMLYCDLIGLALGEAVRKQLEEQMRIQDYEFRSDFAKRYLSQGRAEGEARGQAKALLRILAARGMEVTESQRTQILQCTDPDTLGRWLDRAVTVRLTDELFH
jgi:hypothetical protein